MKFIRTLLEQSQPVGRYVFHATGYAAAKRILQQGKIKGMYIDLPPEERKELQQELGPDYGDYVYTTTFNQRPYTFMGVGGDDVIFVIDTQKAPAGTYEDMENGLYIIPTAVPLNAIATMYITNNNSQQQDQVVELAEKRDIEPIIQVKGMTVDKEQFVDNIKRHGV